MSPWGHDPSDVGWAEYSGYPSAICYPEPGTTYRVTLALGMQGETAIERLFGCLLIATMPQRGIVEALEAVRDIWDYYLSEPQQWHAPQLKRETIKGAVVGERKRPDLVISP